jgi:hypothetical protein
MLGVTECREHAHTKRKNGIAPRFAKYALGLVLLVALTTMGACAQFEPSGWEELKRYAKQEMETNPDFAEECIQGLKLAQEQYGRELTPEETEIWKKGIDAQAVYNRTWRIGIEPSEEDLAVMNAAGEAVFGMSGAIAKETEEAYDRKYPGPDEPMQFEPEQEPAE